MEQKPFIDRDISWLYFNHRVLQEAADPSVPLYERIKFLAIYSSNLDEFFRVRVATWRSIRKLEKNTRKDLSLHPKRQLRAIRHLVQEQQRAFGTIFRNSLLPELESHRIHLIDEKNYTADQRQFVADFFFNKIYPLLKVTPVNDWESPPFLADKVLYFVVRVDSGKEVYVVEIPTHKFSRFYLLPDGQENFYITFLDDMVRYNLPVLLNRKEIEAFSVKMSRDAELHIEDEFGGDLVEKIKNGLENRMVGLPTRFLYDSRMPDDLLAQLRMAYGLTKNDLIPGAKYHNFNDFLSFPNPLPHNGFLEPAWPPLSHPDLEHCSSILDCCQSKDVLLCFPYHCFDYIPRLIREAAMDPDVEQIKITLYRIASDSQIVEALLLALRQGKEVTVFIEAKARFDEEINLQAGTKLRACGGTVLYSKPGLKVHSKLLLILSKRRYSANLAYFGTGNFNEKTAAFYTDLGLLTTHPVLVKEASIVFDFLQGDGDTINTSLLLVAPLQLRPRLVELIDNEISNARRGVKASIFLKLNNLEDRGLIEKLYEASDAGVDVKLIVRGICCLVPGLLDFSDHISAVSIVDRYLEHSRIYVFENSGHEKYFIASADWMTRNLDRRVEVVCPVLDSRITLQIKKMLELQWNDNRKARIHDADGENRYRSSATGEPIIRSQQAIYYLLKNN